MNKKSLLLALIILAGVIFGVAAYVLYQKEKMQSKNLYPADQNYLQQETQNDSSIKNNICSTEYGMINAPRKSAEGAFTTALTSLSAIRVISPGKLVGDMRYTYLWIKNQQRVPIFAPADGVLVQIFYKTRSDLAADLSNPDYDLVFLVDCHTLYRINHVTDPIQTIVAQSPITHPLELKPGSGFNNNDTKPKQNIAVKAGEQIGTTTGTPTAHNFDFGVFVDQQSVCPYSKFIEPVKSEFFALLGNTTNPISGTSCDVSGMY